MPKRDKAKFVSLLLGVYAFYLVSEIKPWKIEQIFADVKNLWKAVESL